MLLLPGSTGSKKLDWSALDVIESFRNFFLNGPPLSKNVLRALYQVDT